MAKRRDGRSLDEALRDEARAERVDTLAGPDSSEGRELARAVGRNVTRYRIERSLDLGALAVRSGIDLERLSAFAAGQAVPSLRALWYLATALEVPFGALLVDTVLSGSTDPDFRIRPADRGRILRSADDRFRSRVLFSEGDPRSPEVYELTLAPDCLEEAAPHASGTFEHIVVTRGAMIVRAGGREARLGPGDSIFFRADVPHSYANPGPDDCVAELVMTYG